MFEEYDFDDGKDDFNRFEEREIDIDIRYEREEFERNLIADYDEEELDPGIYDCEEPELGISDDNWACGTLEVDWGMDD